MTARYDGAVRSLRHGPTRNNRGIATRTAAIESPHGHLKEAIEQALLLRGSRDFDDLTAYRGFIDEIVGRRNARNAKRHRHSSAEHCRRCRSAARTDYEETIVPSPRRGSFTLRARSSTRAPSRLIGHRLKVRLYDDRLDALLGARR